MKRGRLWLLLVAAVFVLFSGCLKEDLRIPAQSSAQEELSRDGSYYTEEDVALYLHLYGCLPANYLTKNKAKELGWVSSEGNLWDVTERGCIGGDRFGNYDGLLPQKKGRRYYECDVNYQGGYRGADRLIYSDDGLIYFTGDHYQSFELLYGEE